MNIIVECISTNKSSLKQLIDTEYCSDDQDANDDTVSCHFAHPVSNQNYRLPDCSVTLADKLMLAENMVPDQKYDCILEIGSFISVELYANYRNSIRGRFWNCVPAKYVPKYSSYKNQQCIEIDGDIILLAPYNNLLLNLLVDESLIEIIPQAPLNLLGIKTERSTSQ